MSYSAKEAQYRTLESMADDIVPQCAGAAFGDLAGVAFRHASAASQREHVVAEHVESGTVEVLGHPAPVASGQCRDRSAMCIQAVDTRRPVLSA